MKTKIIIAAVVLGVLAMSAQTDRLRMWTVGHADNEQLRIIKDTATGCEYMLVVRQVHDAGTGISLALATTPLLNTCSR